MQDEDGQQVAAKSDAPQEELANGERTSEELSRTALERRISELTGALSATRGREADFRQAAFDLNAELLLKDDEITRLSGWVKDAEWHYKERGVELAELQKRVAELEQITETRAFRMVKRWWRVKAAIRPR